MNFFNKKNNNDEYSLLEQAITIIKSASYQEDIKEALETIYKISKIDPILVGTYLQDIISLSLTEFDLDTKILQSLKLNILKNILISKNGKEFAEIILKDPRNLKLIADDDNWEILIIINKYLPNETINCILNNPDNIDKFMNLNIDNFMNLNIDNFTNLNIDNFTNLNIDNFTHIDIDNLDFLIELCKNDDFSETFVFRDGFEQIFILFEEIATKGLGNITEVNKHVDLKKYEKDKIYNNKLYSTNEKLLTFLQTLLKNHKNQTLFLELNFTEFFKKLDQKQKFWVLNSLLDMKNKNFAHIQSVLIKMINFEEAILKREFELIYKLIYFNTAGLLKAYEFKELIFNREDAEGIIKDKYGLENNKNIGNYDDYTNFNKNNEKYRILIIEQISIYFDTTIKFSNDIEYRDIFLFWNLYNLPNLDIIKIKNDLNLISGKNKTDFFLITICILLYDKLDLNEQEIAFIKNIACSNRTIDIIKSMLSLFIVIIEKIDINEILVYLSNIKNLRFLLLREEICISAGLKEFIYLRINQAIEKINFIVKDKIKHEIINSKNDKMLDTYPLENNVESLESLNDFLNNSNSSENKIVKNEGTDVKSEKKFQKFKTFFKNISFVKEKKDESYEM
ncbi:hypothetical protein DMUE_0099 [Dictyocoela muelleri]|nr:hypothetical protein DMUE_0099 [Dictyocoela muelleri]